MILVPNTELEEVWASAKSQGLLVLLDLLFLRSSIVKSSSCINLILFHGNLPLGSLDCNKFLHAFGQWNGSVIIFPRMIER